MKSIRDHGYMVECTKPVKLPRFEASKLPDAGGYVDCLIIVNDRHDGQPRARLALSNGGNWDYFLWPHEVQPQQVVDVVPMVRQAVRDTLPALLPPPMPMPTFAALSPVQVPPTDWAEDRKLFSTALLEMAETINELQRRVHFLEHNALAAEGTTVQQERAA